MFNDCVFDQIHRVCFQVNSRNNFILIRCNFLLPSNCSMQPHWTLNNSASNRNSDKFCCCFKLILPCGFLYLLVSKQIELNTLILQGDELNRLQVEWIERLLLKRLTLVQLPLGTNQRLIKLKLTASLLDFQHSQGTVWSLHRVWWTGGLVAAWPPRSLSCFLFKAT